MYKKELLKILVGFEEHYDRMDIHANVMHDKKRENYACEMWCVTRRLDKKVQKIFRENPHKRAISMNEIKDIFAVWRKDWSEKLDKAIAAGDMRADWFRDKLEALDVLEGRLETAFKRKEKKK